MIVEVLSRVQFAVSIGFHILFPTLNLGLGTFLVLMEIMWLSSKNVVYLRICQFFTKIFAITFGMGVVSGIVLAYQIGTNFGPFISNFGNVLGALFAYETLTAFFLEAGFLGVMLFGWKRVPAPVHFMATLLVAFGTTVSSFWILSANSWMQSPAGYEIVAGKYIVSDWWQVVFNPTAIARWIHMLLASYATTCFVIAAICGYFLLLKKHFDVAKTSLAFVMGAALIILPLQIYMGDVVGLNVRQYQPLKTAAMEAVWDTQKGAPLVLFAIPSQRLQKNLYAVEIPGLASLVNTHSWDGELIGLKSVAPADQPRALPVFFTFRLMVGIGLLMLLTAIIALFLRIRGRLYDSRWFYKWSFLMAPLGFIATIAGWLTAEIGRQPWVVYHLMRTHDAISAISQDEVIISIILLVLVYGVVFGFYLFYLFKTIKIGPESVDDTLEHHNFQYMTNNTGE